MRIHTSYDALARLGGAPEHPHMPRSRHNDRAPGDPDQRQRYDYRRLMGVGVLIAAIVVLLWSGSLVTLVLGSLLAVLLLFAGFLFVLWRRQR